MSEIENKKIKCLECGKSFLRPCSHVWQVHGLSARDYKALHGLDVRRGIATEEYRDRMREHVVKNYKKVVEKNLIKNGIKSRFKKGDHTAGVYERSNQTLTRIRGYNRKRHPRAERITEPCATCGTPVTRTTAHKGGHMYCNRSCATIGNNKSRVKKSCS